MSDTPTEAALTLALTGLRQGGEQRLSFAMAPLSRSSFAGRLSCLSPSL